MSTLDSMLERNKDFAARQSAASTLMPSLPDATPNLKAMIILRCRIGWNWRGQGRPQRPRLPIQTALH